MTRDRAVEYREKQRLVALLRAQIELLRARGPSPLFIGESIDGWLQYYDSLLAAGPTMRWPGGVLPGLKEGVRDLHTMLLIEYDGPRRQELFDKLRCACGDAVELFEVQDAKQLDTIRRRGRIRGNGEYYIVVSAIDRLEGEQSPDSDLLTELRQLAEAAQVRGRSTPRCS